MGLFDDLLKKPSNSTTSNGGSSSGSAYDPLAGDQDSPIKIEKTTETSLQTEEANIVASPEPPKVTASAEDDVSSIIIGGESIDMNATSLTENSTSGENISFITNDAATEAPVISNEQEVTENTPTLFNVLGTDSAEISMEAVEKTEKTEVPATEVVASTTETPVTFDLISETKEPHLSQEVREDSAVFHPEEFIDESLAKIESMIAAIDARHEAKLSEAEGYKSEKERFAEMEKKAHDEADMMIAERNHAERMKNYFMSEKNNQTDTVVSLGSEQKTSVETTLTGLAVQNAVTTTVETKPEVKAANTPTEESSILSLAA